MIYRYGVDVPFRDEWGAFVLQTLTQRDRGTLGISALMTPHKEHRILFSRLITLGNAAWFHWDRRVEMYLSALLLVTAAAFFLHIIREYWGHRWTPLFCLPISWILLSSRQYANLLVGFQTQICLAVAGTVAAFWFLGSGLRQTRMGLAISAAFIATFSFSAGFFIWPIGLFQLILLESAASPNKKPGLRPIALWTCTSLAVSILYFSDYRVEPAQWPHGIGYVLHHPVAAARYTFILFGNPLSFSTQQSYWLGIVVAILFAYSLLTLFRCPKAQWAASAPLLSLVGFSLFSSTAICVGRLGLGPMELPASRYCSLLVLGLAAGYAILLNCAFIRLSLATRVATVGMAALLTLSGVTNVLRWHDDPTVIQFLQHLRIGRYALQNADVLGDSAFLAIQKLPERVRAGIPILRHHGYSLFHDAPPPEPPAAYLGQSRNCVIDQINGNRQHQVEVRRGTQSELEVRGWLLERSALPDRAFLSIEGRVDFPAFVGIQSAGPGSNGLVCYPKLSLIPDGIHALAWKLIEPGSAGYRTCAGSGSIRSIRIAE